MVKLWSFQPMRDLTLMTSESKSLTSEKMIMITSLNYLELPLSDAQVFILVNLEREKFGCSMKKAIIL
jgi:hypothetical protein